MSIKYIGFVDHIDIPSTKESIPVKLVDLATQLGDAFDTHANFMDPLNPDTQELFPLLDSATPAQIAKWESYANMQTAMDMAIASSMPFSNRLEAFSSNNLPMEQELGISLQQLNDSLSTPIQPELVVDPAQAIEKIDLNQVLSNPQVWAFGQTNIDAALSFLSNPPKLITPSHNTFKLAVGKLEKWEQQTDDIYQQYLETMKPLVKAQPEFQDLLDKQKEFARLNFEINTNLKETVRTCYLDGHLPYSDFIPLEKQGCPMLNSTEVAPSNTPPSTAPTADFQPVASPAIPSQSGGSVDNLHTIAAKSD